jgi:signal transduction histidine kinase
MRGRTAWILAAITATLSVADVAVASAYQSLLSEEAVVQHGFPFVELAILGCAVLGAVILSRSEGHRVGVLLVLVGIISAFSLLTEAYSIWVVNEGGSGSRSFAGVAGWLSALTGGQVAIGGIALMFLLAPDGHFLSRRWRVAGWSIALGELCSFVAGATMDPTRFDVRLDGVGPLRNLLFSVGFILVTIGLLAAVVSMVVRLRRSQGEQHRQVRLVALGVFVLAVGVVNLLVVQSLNGGHQTVASSLPLLISYPLLPVFFAVAVLRYRLYDIEVILNWTVVLAFGAAFAALGYTLLVVSVGRVVDARSSGFWLSLVFTALVAVAFQPLRRAVIRAANRLAYGVRAQPYEALSAFSRRLAATPSPTTLLPAVAETACRAVAARHATASLGDAGPGQVSAGWGQEPTGSMTSYAVPVRNQGIVLGEIVVWVERNRPWRHADERLLTAIADQAAVAFRNTAMEASRAEQVADLDRATRQLSDSRSRIVEAEDEARRRLEDAVSRQVLPHLTALPRQLHETRAAIARRAPSNGLDLLLDETNAALESLRELTRGISPTQLARAGLEPALRSLAARSPSAVAVVVDPALAGRRFPPRVEAAVYFCCVRAAVAGLSSVELSLPGPDRLRLDLGLGAGPEPDLQPLRDRVEAAGGTLQAQPGSLHCVIPVPAEGSATDLPAPVALGSGRGPRG